MEIYVHYFSCVFVFLMLFKFEHHSFFLLFGSEITVSVTDSISLWILILTLFVALILLVIRGLLNWVCFSTKSAWFCFTWLWSFQTDISRTMLIHKISEPWFCQFVHTFYLWYVSSCNGMTETQTHQLLVLLYDFLTLLDIFIMNSFVQVQWVT